jgi:hypothetical protein
LGCIGICLIAAWATQTLAAETADLLSAIKAVGREGAGNAAAVAAMQALSHAEPAALPEVLLAFDGANPLATNYLRGAFEAIADRAISQNKGLPNEQLEKFVVDTRQHAQARRLAYEWLTRVDDTAEKRLIPGMLLDPSPEFRRDAVQRLIDAAKQFEAKNEANKAADAYREALKGATDSDLVKAIVEPLRKTGEKIDLQEHFGFIVNWQMIGPFDNREKKGFDAVFPPEKELNLQAKYQGQLGEVNWSPIATEDEYGIVDIAKAVSPYKGAVMYATAEFVSPGKQDVEIRLGTPNAWKLWVNGEPLFAREEYHRGMAIDQYRVKGTLKPGKNTILIKICQNEQDQDWAQRYQFQVRVCDTSGLALLSKTRKTAALEKPPAKRSAGS